VKNFHGTPRAWAEIRGSDSSGHFAVAAADAIADGIIAEGVPTLAGRATKTGRAAAVVDDRNAAAAAVARDHGLSGVPADQAGRGMIAGTEGITPALRGDHN
jgi:ABC-type amino acid transport substrate-binding protein